MSRSQEELRRLGEPGHTAACVGSVLCCQPASPWPGPMWVGVGLQNQPSLVGGGAPVWNMTVQNWNLTHPFCSRYFLFFSRFLYGASRRKAAASRWTDEQRPREASGRGSGQLAISLCAGNVWTVSLAPGRNSRCVFPPSVTEPEGYGGWAGCWLESTPGMMPAINLGCRQELH